MSKWKSKQDDVVLHCSLHVDAGTILLDSRQYHVKNDVVADRFSREYNVDLLELGRVVALRIADDLSSLSRIGW